IKVQEAHQGCLSCENNSAYLQQPLKPTEDHYEDIHRKNQAPSVADPQRPTQAPSVADPQRSTQPRKKKNKTKHKSNAAEAIELAPVPSLPARQ
ncbi:hypothetical protein QTP86_016284, partial [Hemibagrus guttatus]